MRTFKKDYSISTLEISEILSTVNNFKLMEDQVSHEMHRSIDFGFQTTVSSWMDTSF